MCLRRAEQTLVGERRPVWPVPLRRVRHRFLWLLSRRQERIVVRVARLLRVARAVHGLVELRLRSPVRLKHLGVGVSVLDLARRGVSRLGRIH